MFSCVDAYIYIYLDKSGVLNLALREYLNFLDFLKVFLIIYVTEWFVFIIWSAKSASMIVSCGVN
jgi:hypothetical protein